MFPARRPPQGELNSHRARLESDGWSLEWYLFPRAANAAADRLANAVREGTRPASHAWCGGAAAVPQGVRWLRWKKLAPRIPEPRIVELRILVLRTLALQILGLRILELRILELHFWGLAFWSCGSWSCESWSCRLWGGGPWGRGSWDYGC